MCLCKNEKESNHKHRRIKIGHTVNYCRVKDSLCQDSEPWHQVYCFKAPSFLTPSWRHRVSALSGHLSGTFFKAVHNQTAISSNHLQKHSGLVMCQKLKKTLHSFLISVSSRKIPKTNLFLPRIFVDLNQLSHDQQTWSYNSRYWQFEAPSNSNIRV